MHMVKTFKNAKKNPTQNNPKQQQQNPGCNEEEIFLLPQTCLTPRHSHSSRFLDICVQMFMCKYM